MAQYRVERMNGYNYSRMMSGEMFYTVDTVIIEATTKETAIEIASEYGTWIVNENYIITVEEYEAKEAKLKAEREARKAEEEAKKQRAKANKEAREQAKAEEMGVTIEAYKEWKKRQDKIRKYEREVAKLMEEVEWRQRYIEKLKAQG
jgi:hypothetical protein